MNETIGPVLIIDDERVVRERLRMLLESAGYVVFTATDGSMALDLLRAIPFAPRLVIVDLVMPGMDGRQFLDSFRSEPQWRSTSVVMYTSADTLLPRGVRKLRREASDATILKLARQTCRRELC